MTRGCVCTGGGSNAEGGRNALRACQRENAGGRAHQARGRDQVRVDWWFDTPKVGIERPSRPAA